MARPAQQRAAAEQEEGSDHWPIERLQPNPLNPRAIEPDDPSIDALAASIREVGLLQPIVCTPAGLIIAGHRRLVACRRAGLTHVPVRVQDLDEAGQLSAMLAENLARRALNPVETARACRGLTDRGVSADVVAKRCGLGRQTVLNHLAIVELPPVLQEKIASFEMPLGMAPHLAKLPSEASRIAVGLKAYNEGWTVVRLAEHVMAVLAPTPAAASRAASGGAPAAQAPRPSSRRMGSSRPAAASAGSPAVSGDGTVATLNTLTITIRRQPELVRLPLVWEALERLVGAVREARG